MERRGFLKAGTAGFASLVSGAGLLTWAPRSEAATISKTLYITAGTHTMPDGVSVYIKGFSDSSADLNVPATPIVCQEGDTLEITITYTFPTGKAGSYLFYDNKSSYNVFLGLHGRLAIMPAGSSNQLYSGSPTFVKQLSWVFNDIDPALNSAVQHGTTVPTSFTPRYFTINGQTSLPPGAVGFDDPTRDAMANPETP